MLDEMHLQGCPQSSLARFLDAFESEAISSAVKAECMLVVKAFDPIRLCCLRIARVFLLRQRQGRRHARYLLVLLGTETVHSQHRLDRVFNTFVVHITGQHPAQAMTCRHAHKSLLAIDSAILSTLSLG